MGEWLRSFWEGGAILGHLSYVFLILSMLMDKVFYLRLFALAAGLAGIVYFWAFLGDRVASIWEVLFIAANLFQVALTAYRNRMARFTADEIFFRNTVVPGLATTDVRRLLRASTLRDVQPGAILTRENEIATELAFIVSGEVDIVVADRPVARCGRGQLVGEISISSGTPATATAVAATPVRYLAFDGKALQRLIRRYREIGTEMELAFRNGLREKLVQANAAIAAQAGA